MHGFEQLDISGDAGIRAYGSSLQELFSNAALGMYSLMTDLGGMGETEKLSVVAGGGSLEGLLVAWLNELIFRFDVYGFVGRVVVITDFVPAENSLGGAGTFSLTASLMGETFDPERHEGRLLVKAATYHGLEVKKKDDVWTAEIIFDI